MRGFDNIGLVCDPEGLKEHLLGVDTSWVKGLTIHHTTYPDLSMRPKGFTVQHMRNIRFGYESSRGWDRGPHGFIDEDQLFGMTPFGMRGIHATGLNRTHIGFELLGNFDREEEAKSPRGRAVFKSAVRFAAAFLQATGLPVESINGHRDSGRADKTCPGKYFDLEEFRKQVAFLIDRKAPDPADLPPVEDVVEALSKALEERIESARWQLDQMEKELAKLRS